MTATAQVAVDPAREALRADRVRGLRLRRDSSDDTDEPEPAVGQRVLDVGAWASVEPDGRWVHLETEEPRHGAQALAGLTTTLGQAAVDPRPSLYVLYQHDTLRAVPPPGAGPDPQDEA